MSWIVAALAVIMAAQAYMITRLVQDYEVAYMKYVENLPCNCDPERRWECW